MFNIFSLKAKNRIFRPGSKSSTFFWGLCTLLCFGEAKKSCLYRLAIEGSVVLVSDPLELPEDVGGPPTVSGETLVFLNNSKSTSTKRRNS